VCYRALHIAVAQGQEAQIQRMILLLELVHTDLDIYNNLRQVRYMHEHTQLCFQKCQELLECKYHIFLNPKTLELKI
jgi:hypothetical protein